MLKTAGAADQDVAALLRTAVQFSQAGQHIEALELIDKALASAPHVADAHNNRGNVLRVLGRPDEAIGAYREALVLAPTHPLAWCNMGNALRDLGRVEEAVRAYREAIARRPAFAEAQLNLGIALREQGRHAEALSAFEAATRLRPDFAAAHDSLGNALRDAGRLSEAIEAYRRAVALDPEFTTGYCNLGAALWQAERFEEAADALQAALALDPGRPEAHNHMGNVCKSMGYLGQALSAYRQALALKPDFAAAHFNLGVLLGDLDQPNEALASYKAALGFAPEYADAHSNLGATLMRLDRPAEAITAYRRALELRPEFAGAWYNLGNALAEESRPREAVAAFDRALAIDPDLAVAHWSRGLASLSAGDYPRGWEGYEWRARVTDDRLGDRSLPGPRWDGRPLEGRTILVHAERGLGDTLMFARYLPLVAARGGRVVLECQPALTRLLEAMPSVGQVVAQGEPLPAFDCHVPLQSLAAVFGTRLGSIPDEVPYLPTQTWSNRVPVLPAGTGLRVGLVWGGSPRPTRRRSIPLGSLTPLFDVPGVTWYSLQMGEHAAALMDLGETRRPINLGPMIRDFADTAALAGQLDLIVSVDTSVAHLAGGLGLPVWVMLVAAPDWSWLSGGIDSPWYPSARIFRQSRPGDWAPVIEEVRRALVASLSSVTA